MPVIRVHQFAEIEVEFEGEFFTEKVLIGWAVYEVNGNVALHRGFERNAHC